MVICASVTSPVLTVHPKCMNVVRGVVASVAYDCIELDGVVYPVDADGQCPIPDRDGWSLWPLDHTYHPGIIDRLRRFEQDRLQIFVAYDLLMINMFSRKACSDLTFLQTPRGEALYRSIEKCHADAQSEDFAAGVFVWSEAYFAECVRATFENLGLGK